MNYNVHKLLDKNIYNYEIPIYGYLQIIPIINLKKSIFRDFY